MALESRSLVFSFLLHAGLVGALYGLGLGSGQLESIHQLTVSLEQPEPTPYIEAEPEPVEEEEEVEQEVEVELERPVIEESIEELTPQPEFVLDETPPEDPIQSQVWLTKVVTIKKEPAPKKKKSEAEQKPQLPNIEPKPLVGKNPPPMYPKLAIRNQLQGTTILEVKVDDEGIVGDIRIIQSSGYKILDEAAIRAVHDWRFDSGPGIARVPIIFNLRTRK